MTAHPQAEIPDLSREQKQEREVIKLIRKLRWIGLEDEAKRVLVSAGETPPTDRAIAGPRETD